MSRGGNVTNKTSLLRKESFGGTLYNATSGKRVYLDLEEYSRIKELGILTPDLQDEIKVISPALIIREPIYLPSDNFSAPDTVFFEVTRVCNLTCVHCFNESGVRLPDEMSDEQRVSAVADLCDAGVQEVRFTGGEPLVVNAVYNYIAFIRENGLRASIGTNGALISPAVAARLANADLNTAITSIDGMEEKHDSIRGAGSFQKTLDGIQALLDVGISVRVNTVVMKSNTDEVVRVAEYFAGRKIPVMIRRLIPAGRADSMMQEMLTDADYGKLKARLDPILSDPSVHVRGHYLKDDKVSPRITLPFERRACSAGHRGLVVLPNGAIQTCGFLGPLGERSPGNLKDENLATVWGRLVQSEHVQSMRELLPGHNQSTSGPKTNCLAIAMATQQPLIQIKGVRHDRRIDRVS